MLCSPRTDRHTHRQTHTCTKVNTEDTLSGFQEFFLQPIIKDRSNSSHFLEVCIRFRSLEIIKTSWEKHFLDVYFFLTRINKIFTQNESNSTLFVHVSTGHEGAHSIIDHCQTFHMFHVLRGRKLVYIHVKYFMFLHLQ